MSVDKGTSEKCSERDSGAPPLVNRSTSLNAAITKRETLLRRTNESFRSMRFYVSDLLKRAELQSKLSAQLFPLMDKEQDQNRKLSPAQSDDTLEDIVDYKGINSNVTEKQIDTDLSRDVYLTEANTLEDQVTHRMDINKRNTSALENRSCQMSAPVTFVRRLSLPTNELPSEYAVATKANIDCSILFGVNIEYVAFRNQLKASIKRFGNLPSRYGKKKQKYLIAKLCLLPGNTQKQKVRVTNGLDTSLDKYLVYFNQSCATDFTRRKIGVSVYIKQSFLKRQTLIYEWTISMENFNFIEPQTAWKKID